MIKLQNVCYVRLGTRDLEGATQFATDILGLEVSEWGKATRLFKSDAREHTLCYVEGDPGFQVTGFEVANKEDLDQAASELEKLGHPVYVGTLAEADSRMAARLYRLFGSNRQPDRDRVAASRQWHPLPRYARRWDHRL